MCSMCAILKNNIVLLSHNKCRCLYFLHIVSVVVSGIIMDREMRYVNI